ncbi:hypothetical protein PV379_00090 [Streptomyces caniscabiei]|uniref:hypothetical protein n=1 Tax=Streptomyces caniscabiei TaxID=2746961 RepID=UPI0029B496B3|nr:hypothetical protein [Streptomyces caniscabiei]MDX2775760.1 hypothetical protein [Streptomyces caniscabiei]
MKFLILCFGALLGAAVAIPIKTRAIAKGGHEALQTPLFTGIFVVAYVCAAVFFTVYFRGKVTAALCMGSMMLTIAVIWSF